MITPTLKRETAMCKCGNQGCAVREARGLKPFCQMTAADASRRTVPGFDTMEACKAAHPAHGAVFRSISSLHSGGPRTRRWFPTGLVA
jgi:hypothetical protein